MLNITHSSVFVLDQDEALDFYVGKLGFEVSTDADLGFMRWLTVHFPGQPDHQLLLEKPTSKQISVTLRSVSRSRNIARSTRRRCR